MAQSLPIGLFDSGVGGLTVMAAVRKALPRERLVYLGDTARVPYGTKSPEVVRRYAVKCAQFLLEQGAKMVVVACNTASAHAIPALRAELEVPVVGVIEPGARLAAETTRNGRVGVIGTEGTVASGTYQESLGRARPGVEVHAVACPMFVPLAEEGLCDHPATRLLAQDYLSPLKARDIDTLVLGCTHYPLLSPAIEQVMGPSIRIVDSAGAVAAAAAAVLRERGLEAAHASGDDTFYATDVSARVLRVGSAFLGRNIEQVRLVDL
ncbi:MAG: glutamate racemase [Deltaproteobacteria bacterium]|nr:glutamate racemase [Deltaproteobacteria bacterium]